MKQNRNVVRLTESQLNAMIAESVNNVLNEIDWKTANWAANERARRNADVSQNRWNSPYAEKYEKMGGGSLSKGIAKGENAAERSNDAAIKAFNDKYKGGDDRFGEGVRYMTGSNGKAGVFAQARNNGQTVTVHTPTDRTSQDSQFRMNVSDGDLDHRNYRGADKSTVMQNLSKANPGMANRFNDAHDEVENYNNGNNYYDNGWKLKESRIYQIVSESIDRVLGRR